MYKVACLILTIFLALLSIHYVATRWSHDKETRELQNKIAKLEGKVKETETAYSVRGVEIDNLKASNKELQRIIEKRDEEIVAIGKASLSWKKKYFAIKDATQTPVDENGTVVEVPADCATCLNGVRFRVDFAKTMDWMKVEGYTLTNPAEAHLSVSSARQLQLHFILAKQDDKLRLYMDLDSPDIVAGELTLTVDPSVFEKKWYEKIAFGGKLNVGEGVVTSLGVGYEVREGLVVGPSMSMFYNGERGLLKLYGADVLWFPFR